MQTLINVIHPSSTKLIQNSNFFLFNFIYHHLHADTQNCLEEEGKGLRKAEDTVLYILLTINHLQDINAMEFPEPSVAGTSVVRSEVPGAVLMTVSWPEHPFFLSDIISSMGQF